MTAPAGDKRARVSTALAALLVLGAYAALAGEKQPREYLDEDTAATVTVVGEPLVFAYAHPTLAANQRDYVTLAAAAVNRNGKVSYVLIAYFWSTIDPRLRQDPLPSPAQLVIQADATSTEPTSGPCGSSARRASSPSSWTATLPRSLTSCGKTTGWRSATSYIT
ncbi:MAG: hypothetical protein E6K46_11310 [Gammaproteobacteria bacterium]|nr:MAG: hypothetical protein E6K46_11310 [Gammaproteobacteria bacterium]